MYNKLIKVFLVLVLFYSIYLIGKDFTSETGDRFELTIEKLTKNHPFNFPVSEPSKDGLKRSAMRGNSLNCTLEGGYFVGLCYSLFVNDTLAFANFGRNLKILNIADSSNPICLGEIKVASVAYDIFATDSLVYVSTEDSGLRIIDISDPVFPAEIGYYNPNGGWMGGIYVKDSFAYIASTDSGFQVINIADPENPVKVGEFKEISLNYESRIEVKDSLAYVAFSYGGVKIIDVSNLFSPNTVGSYDMGGMASAKAVHIKDTLAYVALGDSGFCILNVTNPASPEFVGGYVTGGFAIDVSVRDTIACLTDVDNGITIFNVSDPASISVIDVYRGNTLSAYMRVELIGNLVYVSDLGYGFRIIDISSGVSEIGNYDTWVLSNGIAVVDTLAFIASYPAGLHVMNVSNSETPSGIGYCDTRLDAYDVFVADSFAYFANGDSGLSIINISNPSSPFQIGSCNTRGISYGVFIEDTLAYIADEDSGLSIVNVSDPSLPIEIGNCYTKDKAINVFIQDTLAFVADADSGLSIIDVSDPTNPFQIGSFKTVGSVNDVYVQDSFAFLADFGSKDFRILNVSNPVSPTEIGSYPGIEAFNIQVIDTIAYVASYADGLQILNISNSLSPQLVGYYTTEDCAFFDVSLANNLIYVTDSLDGLYIIRCPSLSGITKEKTKSLQDNSSLIIPSNIALSSLNFTYKGNTSGTVVVRDITGRVIKEYPNVSPETLLSFGDEGISSGIYFIYVKGNDKGEKIVLIK